MPVIKMKVKRFQYDRRAIEAAIGRARTEALTIAGAFVRRKVQQSIRSSKRVSQPGRPPNSHTGFLKNTVIFAIDTRTKTVVIGPLVRPGSNAPRLLEFGGSAIRKGKVKRYRQRPFMKPALQKSYPEIQRAWENKFKKG